MTAPFKNVATFFANMKMEKGNCENGKVGEKVSLPLPVASGIHHQTVFLVDERKSSSERRKSEKSQPARVVRVEQELHTHRHTETLTHTHGKWRLGRGKAKHTKPKAKAKENPHPLRGKAIGKACAVRECCEIQRRRRRRQRRWQRSCDWCALWKMASIMRCATAVVVVFGACLLARHGANNKEYGKV